MDSGKIFAISLAVAFFVINPLIIYLINRPKRKKTTPIVIASYDIASLLYSLITHIGANDPDFRANVLSQTTGFRYNNKAGTLELIQHRVRDGHYDTRHDTEQAQETT